MMLAPISTTMSFDVMKYFLGLSVPSFRNTLTVTGLGSVLAVLVIVRLSTTNGPTATVTSDSVPNPVTTVPKSPPVTPPPPRGMLPPSPSGGVVEVLNRQRTVSTPAGFTLYFVPSGMSDHDPFHSSGVIVSAFNNLSLASGVIVIFSVMVSPAAA